MALVEWAWRPEFPSGELVSAAAGLLPGEDLRARDSPYLREGPQWELVVGPGIVQVRTRNYVRLERSATRRAEAAVKLADAVAAEWARKLRELAAEAIADGLLDADDPDAVREFSDEAMQEVSRPVPPRGRKIDHWSYKSRREFAAKIGKLDLGPLARDPDGRRLARMPGVITLTYPGDWLASAPNDRVVKKHLRRFRARWEREWGPIRAIWKEEFQGRGAPHFHILTSVPTWAAKDGRSLRQWLSEIWAECVDAQDPEERRRHRLAGTRVDFKQGLRMIDPKRVAEYFLKHGSGSSKEYQHRVPEEWLDGDGGTGRFWGVWGLEEAVSTVAVLPAVGIWAGRVARRWHRAQIRAAYGRDGEAGLRARRYKPRLFVQNRGRLLVNDGAAFMSQLARFLDQCCEELGICGVIESLT